MTGVNSTVVVQHLGSAHIPADSIVKVTISELTLPSIAGKTGGYRVTFNSENDQDPVEGNAGIEGSLIANVHAPQFVNNGPGGDGGASVVLAIDMVETAIYDEAAAAPAFAPAVLGTVHATDSDAREVERPTYRLLSTVPPTNLFEVNAASGAVSTANFVSFDGQPSQYTLLVEAADAAAPYWKTNGTVTINVLDANDHSPVFVLPAKAPRYYTAVIHESASAVGDVALQVVATDADSGANSNITFAIDPPTDGFTIDASTGRIVITQQFSREARPHTVLQVSAADNPAAAAEGSGDPQRFASAIVSIDTISDAELTFVTVSVRLDADGLPDFDPAEYTSTLNEALCIDVVDCQLNAAVFTSTPIERPANPFAQTLDLAGQQQQQAGAPATDSAADEMVEVEVGFFVRTAHADDTSPGASAYMPMLEVLPALLAPDAAVLLENRGSLNGIKSATFAAVAGAGSSMATSASTAILWDTWLIVAVAVSGTLFCVIWIIILICCGCCPACCMCCACCPKRDKVKILTGSATWGDAWTSGSADASVLTGLGLSSALNIPSPVRTSGRMPHYSIGGGGSMMADSVQYFDPVSYPSYLVDPAIQHSRQTQGIAMPPPTLRKRPGSAGESYLELVDPSTMVSPEHELSVLYDGDAEYFGQEFANPVYGSPQASYLGDPSVRASPQLARMRSSMVPPQRQSTVAFPTSMPAARSSYASPAVSPQRTSYASPQMVTMSLPQQPQTSYVRRSTSASAAQAMYSGAPQQFSRSSAVHFNPAGPSFAPAVRMNAGAPPNNAARRASSAAAMSPMMQSRPITPQVHHSTLMPSRPTTPHGLAMDQGNHVPFDASWNDTEAALMGEMEPVNQWTTMRPNEQALQVLHEGDLMFGQSQNNPLYRGDEY